MSQEGEAVNVQADSSPPPPPEPPISSVGSPRLARHQSHMVESFRSRSLSRQMSADTSASLARGEELYAAGRYKEAADQYEFFVTANAHKEDAQQQLAQGLLSLGRCQIRLDRLQEATDSLAKCIRKAQELGDGLLVGWAYCEFGLTLEKTGQIESAFKSYKRAYTQAKDSHDRELECKAVTRMGRVLEDTGKHLEAKRLYERSLPSKKSPSRADTKMTMEITRRLGRVLYDLQRYVEAHEAYEGMRAAAKRLEDHVAHGYSEIGIAECCVAIGMKDEAAHALRRALRVFHLAQYERGALSTTRRLAVTLASDGKDKEAFQLYNTVLDASQSGITLFTGPDAMTLAQSMENLGRLDDALRLYRHGIKWFQDQEDQDAVREELEAAHMNAERIEIALRFSDGDLFDLCASDLLDNAIFNGEDDDVPARGRAWSRSRTNVRGGAAFFARLRRFFSDTRSPPGSKQSSPKNSPRNSIYQPRPPAKPLSATRSKDDTAALPKPRRRRTISG